MNNNQWQESDSEIFIKYGRAFIPQREKQVQIMVDAISPLDGPFHIMELACGDGTLAEALLTRFADAVVHGYDLSPQMLETAQQRLADYGRRFQPMQFDLHSTAWRRPSFSPHAVVSSLTIHHLDGSGKAQLFADVYEMLAPGGVFVVADLILPANPQAREIAADGWDTAVRTQADADNTPEAFDAFLKLQWNLHRYPEDPKTGIDKPSTLLEQLNWMEQAGFDGVDVLWMMAGHVIFMGVKGVGEL